MSGVPPPGRSAPTISTANPPVLIDFVSHVPAPVTRLLVEQAGTIRALRRAAEIASWKSPKVSESWILLAVWWFLVPLFVISPALWRHLTSQTWWPWKETSKPLEPVSASDATVAATISDITALRLLLPPFLFTSTPVPSRSPILEAIRITHSTLPLKSLLRATAILYIPYLLATWLIPLPVLFGLVGTIMLTIRAPWICVVRSQVAENGWARWIWRRVWAFLTGLPVVIPGSTFTLQRREEKPSVAPKGKKSVAQELKPNRLRFRFDILENQRWWVGIDWSSALLPNERQSWCSPPPHLAPLSPPITFTLPPPTSHIDKTLKIRRKAFWRWEDPEWTVLVKQSHDSHHSRLSVPLPDVSSDSEGRLAKGLKRVGESLPESVNGSVASGRRLSDSGDDESHEAPLSPSVLLNDPLTDPDGWVYADNKWEGPSPKGGIGKYTRYRIWSRSAVLIEEIEDLDDAELAATVTTPSGTEQSKNGPETFTSGVFPPPTKRSHRFSASEDILSSGVGHSSGVNDRESRLTSRLKSVLENRGGGTKA
ncbi:integral peroxisomal membrane peroxin protein [Ceratobasidium sp. AG-Ba]|nr:integral peroxisomal membrane peroxin protein [Ceratobasidium sp. AG-Ba]QRV98791.1 integral peroxisomal membrane peroxin protein [Ceratobasidium sp. AG-Ba]